MKSSLVYIMLKKYLRVFEYNSSVSISWLNHSLWNTVTVSSSVVMSITHRSKPAARKTLHARE